MTVTRPAAPPGVTRTKCERCPQTPVVARFLRCPIHWALPQDGAPIGGDERDLVEPVRGSGRVEDEVAVQRCRQRDPPGLLRLFVNVRRKTDFRFAVQGCEDVTLGGDEGGLVREEARRR